MITLIWAESENGVIGKDGQLPWSHHSGDMQHFRERTMGHIVVMGRKTYESIGKPLQGRYTVVLTRNDSYQSQPPTLAFIQTPGAVVLTEMHMEQEGEAVEVFIAGGKQLYDHFMPVADRIYRTVIKGEYEGDTHAPYIDPNEWEKVGVKHDKGAMYSVYERLPGGDKSE